MNFMNIPAIKNQQQTLIKRNFDKIYAHEAAHKRAGGALAGIIAGRIREKYNKPTFILTKSEDGVKGSGRSIEEYSM